MPYYIKKSFFRAVTSVFRVLWTCFICGMKRNETVYEARKVWFFRWISGFSTMEAGIPATCMPIQYTTGSSREAPVEVPRQFWEVRIPYCIKKPCFRALTSVFRALWTCFVHNMKRNQTVYEARKFCFFKWILRFFHACWRPGPRLCPYHRTVLGSTRWRAETVLGGSDTILYHKIMLPCIN